VNAEFSATCENGDNVCFVQMDDNIADASNIEILEETQPFRALLKNWCADSDPSIANNHLDLKVFAQKDLKDIELMSDVIIPVTGSYLNNDVSQDFEIEPGDSFTQVTDVTLSPGLKGDDTLEISCLSKAKETPPPKLTFKRRRSLNDTPSKRVKKAMKVLHEPVEQVELQGPSEPCGKVLDSDVATTEPALAAGDASYVSITDESADNCFQLSFFESELMGDMGHVLHTLGFTGEEFKGNCSCCDEKNVSGELVTPDSSQNCATATVGVVRVDNDKSIDSGLENSVMNQTSCPEFHSFGPVSIPDSVNVTKMRLSRLSYLSQGSEKSTQQERDEDGNRHVKFSFSPVSTLKETPIFSDIPRKLDLDEEPSLLRTLCHGTEEMADQQKSEPLVSEVPVPSPVRLHVPDQEANKKESPERETYFEHLRRRGKLPRSICSMTNKYKLHKSSDAYGTMVADWKISSSTMKDYLWSSSSSPTVKKLQEEHCPTPQNIGASLPSLSLVGKEEPLGMVRLFGNLQAGDFKVSPNTKRSGCCIVIVVTDPNGLDAVMDVVEVPKHLRYTSSGPDEVTRVNSADGKQNPVENGSGDAGVETVDVDIISRDERDVLNNSFLDGSSTNNDLLEGKTPEEKPPRKLKRKKSVLQRVARFFQNLHKPEMKQRPLVKMQSRTQSKQLADYNKMEVEVDDSLSGSLLLSESLRHVRRPPNSFESLSDGEVDFPRLVSADSDSLSDGEAVAVMRRPFRLIPYESDEEMSLVRMLYLGVVTGSEEILDRREYINQNKSIHTSTPLRSKFKTQKNEQTENCASQNNNAVEVKDKDFEPTLFQDEVQQQRRCARKVQMILEYSSELKQAGLNPPKLPVSKEDLEASIHNMSSDELSFLAANVVDGTLSRVQHELEKQQRNNDEDNFYDLGTNPLFSSDDDVSECRTNLSESVSADQHLAEILETTCDSEHAEPFYSIAYVSPNGTSYKFNC
jgi:hypothetical protein